MSARGQMFAGARAISGVMLGTSAWGLVVGVALIKTGLSVPQALGMSFLVYSGSAQLASLPLMASVAPIPMIWLTSLVMNLRFVIFSASLAPQLAHLPKRWQVLLGYLNGDSAFVLFDRYNQNHPDHPERHWWMLGAAGYSWLGWQLTTIAGIVLASQVPDQWGLALAGTLALLALAMSVINGLPVVIGAITAGVVAVACASWPLRLGLLTAVIAGIAAGWIFESIQSRRR